MAGKAQETIDDAALRWRMAVHDAPQDPQVRAGLAAWLALSPAHRAAYDEACRLWMLTGLMAPAANEGDTSRDDSSRDDNSRSDDSAERRSS